MNQKKPFASRLSVLFNNIFGTLRKVRRKWYILTIILLAIFLPVIIYFDLIYLFASEQISWQVTKMKDTEQAYAKYKEEQYKGMYFEEAASRHAEILWGRVQDMKEPYQVKALVFDFEDVKYFEMAKQKYDVLLWDSVCDVNSGEAYTYYLEIMEHGANRKDAKEAMTSLNVTSSAADQAPGVSLSDDEVMDNIMDQYEETYGE